MLRQGERFESVNLAEVRECALGQNYERAVKSLQGLSIGDAFGDRFFGQPGAVWARIANRIEPEAPWAWTDDSAMARVIVAQLRDHQSIDSKALAQTLASEYRRDMGRGYGNGAAEILNKISHGVSWQEASREAFGGSGSYGNGAAMRAAPIGAYFAGDIPNILEEAKKAALVTHSHPEGLAGGIAVALAAAWATQSEPSHDVLEFVIEHLVQSQLRDKLLQAQTIPLDSKVSLAADTLGNGTEVSAVDTVPFTLWMVARHRGDFKETLWETVGALGDRDTTCAIVGGIIASSPNQDTPDDWLANREFLGLAHL